MREEERINELTGKLSDDFEKKSNGAVRSDLAGIYTKDDKLHIILVNNGDIGYYKRILNDDNVEYHYTDVSYKQLFDTRNLLRDVYDKYDIYEAAINDETSQIELTVIDNGMADKIKDYLKSKGVSDLFIADHVVFIEDKDILNHIPNFYDNNEDIKIDECTIDESSDEEGTKSIVFVYPGQRIYSPWRNPSTGITSNKIATIGFDGMVGNSLGFVTAWHFSFKNEKFYLHSVVSLPDNAYIGTNGNKLSNQAYDTEFINFDSGDGSTIILSRKIFGTDIMLDNTASSSTISTLFGKTLQLYGAGNQSSGTVVSTSTDYMMNYVSESGSNATTRVYDTIKVKGTSEEHGDSGGPVTYGSGTNVTLVGTISGISGTSPQYTFINKISNICDGMRITLMGEL